MVKRLARYMRVGRRLFGRLCRRPERRQASRGLPLAPADAAHPGLEHEAVHHHRGSGPLRRRGHARHRGARRRASSTPRACSAAASTCAAAATRPSAAARFTTRSYGGGATVQDLAALLEDIGIERITGRVYGDESAFDSLRGGPDSGYGVSPWVGPLSALSYNRGLFTESGRGFQANPPAFAAARLDAALEARGVTGAAEAARRASRRRGARVLASVDSPPMSRLIRLTNKPSDNFFAEMLAQGPRAPGRTGAAPPPAARGSSASPRSRARHPAPRSSTAQASRAATAPRRRASSAAHARCTRSERLRRLRGLAADRGPGRHPVRPDAARSGAADRCRGKTGTLSNVSALSGYCEARSGDNYAYSILMNGVYPTGARKLQDLMLQALSRLG